MLREIAGRRLGADAPVFVIAEIGLNHGGSLNRALELVDAAAWAGASAVKLQTVFADRLVTASCPAPAHVDASSLRGFFAQFELTMGGHRAVVDRARALGLAVMTTPFAEDVLPALHAIGFDAYKIASGDITYDGLIRTVAATGRPLVVSTGMSDLGEVRHAADLALRAGAGGLALLHCVSAYPTPIEAQNLRAIRTLQENFPVPVGLSDHGTGRDAAIAAVALGASVYERHLVLEDDQAAIDRAVSSTPGEFKAIIAALEATRIALGSGAKVCQGAEAPNVVPSRRGLYATRAMAAGERVTRRDVAVLRPAGALPPSAVEALVGATLTRPLAAGAAFEPCDVGATAAPSAEAGRRVAARPRRIA